MSDSTYYSRNTSNSKSLNQVHKISNIYFHKLDKKVDVANRTFFTFYDKNRIRHLETNYITTDSTTLFNNNTKETSLLKDFQLSNILYISKRFQKANRSLTLIHNINYTSDRGENSLWIYNIYPSNVDSTDQVKDVKNSNLDSRLKITWVEPIFQNFTFHSTYLMKFGTQEKHILTYDRNSIPNIIDTSFSGKFNVTTIYHTVTEMFKYQKKALKIFLGTEYRYATINADEELTTITSNLKNSFLFPFFSIELSPQKTRRFIFKYSTSSNLPTIQQLQPIRDNANPNFIQIGNPHLKPTYTHLLLLNLYTWNMTSNNSINANLKYLFSNDDFSNQLITDEFGRIFIKTINIDNSALFSANINLSKNITLLPSGGYNRSWGVSILNTNMYSLTTDNFSSIIGIEYNNNKFLSIGFGGGIEYSSPKNGLNNISNPFLTYGFESNIDLTLLKKMNIICSTNSRWIENRSTNFYRNYNVINISLAYNFLKKIL